MHFLNEFRSWQFKYESVVWNCFYRDFRFSGQINIFNFSVSVNRLLWVLFYEMEQFVRVLWTNFIDFDLRENCSYWMPCKYQDNLKMIRILSAMLIDIWKLYRAEENVNFSFFFFLLIWTVRWHGAREKEKLEFFLHKIDHFVRLMAIARSSVNSVDVDKPWPGSQHSNSIISNNRRWYATVATLK